MAGKGGYRPGAGRPRGSINKVTEKARQEAERTGETPLQFLLKVMRDETLDLEQRKDAAKAAAQYVHPKLSAIAAKLDEELDIRAWMIAAQEIE